MDIRENLLITMGVRAGCMDVHGYITLPEGSTGEDAVATFVSETVTSYLQNKEDINFDEYIETALVKKYGKGDCELCMQIKWPVSTIKAL